ncbi:hypothetical protein JCM19992_18480 [Thermostilla marina]
MVRHVRRPPEIRDIPQRTVRSGTASACPRRRGLTLIELLIAISLMLLIVTALAALQSSSVEVYGQASARRTLIEDGQRLVERIRRTVEHAQANENYAGAWVVSESVAEDLFPVALVVWAPDTGASNPAGTPLVKELVVFAPDPENPTLFCEYRLPGSSANAPAIGDQTAWRAVVNAIRSSPNVEKIVLSRHVRWVTVGGHRRPAVRFAVRVTPDDAEWDDEVGTAWNELPWPQGNFTPEIGVRQVWVKSEFQLAADTGSKIEHLTVFGSAALYYPLAESDRGD